MSSKIKNEGKSTETSLERLGKLLQKHSIAEPEVVKHVNKKELGELISLLPVNERELFAGTLVSA